MAIKCKYTNVNDIRKSEVESEQSIDYDGTSSKNTQESVSQLNEKYLKVAKTRQQNNTYKLLREAVQRNMISEYSYVRA